MEASPFDKVAYLFAMIGLYMMVGGLMFYGFWEKAVDGNFKIAPPLAAQFDKTFIGTFPGSTAAWVVIICSRFQCAQGDSNSATTSDGPYWRLSGKSLFAGKPRAASCAGDVS